MTDRVTEQDAQLKPVYTYKTPDNSALTKLGFVGALSILGLGAAIVAVAMDMRYARKKIVAQVVSQTSEEELYVHTTLVDVRSIDIQRWNNKADSYTLLCDVVLNDVYGGGQKETSRIAHSVNRNATLSLDIGSTLPSELREGMHLDVFVEGTYNVSRMGVLPASPPTHAYLRGWSVSEKE